MEEVANRIRYMETFLSPNVHYIIVECRQNMNSTGHITHCLTEKYTFDWHKIKTSLALSDNIHIFSQPADWFHEVIKKMWLIFQEAHSKIINISPEAMEHFWDFCKWTGKEKELKEFFEDFQSFNNTSTVEAILFVTSVLERSLGNIYLLRGKTVPFLLRDLLATSELKSFLGTIPTIFLQLLVGTPLSLNVRNLVWHGFPHPNEIPSSLATALFVVVASVGQLLSVESTSISCRPQARDLPLLAEQLEPPPDLVPHAVLEVLTESLLIPSQHIAFWTSALQHYHRRRFHNITIVKKAVLQMVKSIIMWKQYPRPPEMLWPNWNAVLNMNKDVYNLYQHVMRHVLKTLRHQKGVNDIEQTDRYEDITEILEVFLSCVHIPVMPLPKCDAEAISVLRQVIWSIQVIHENVTANLELKAQLLAAHKLRSRQRITYGRFINIVPRLEAVLMCVVIIVSVHLLEISTVHSISERDQVKYIRFLRTVLQFVELAASGSSHNKNRWEEINTLSRQFCQQMLQSKHIIPTEHLNEQPSFADKTRST